MCNWVYKVKLLAFCQNRSTIPGSKGQTRYSESLLKTFQWASCHSSALPAKGESPFRSHLLMSFKNPKHNLWNWLDRVSRRAGSLPSFTLTDAVQPHKLQCKNVKCSGLKYAEDGHCQTGWPLRGHYGGWGQLLFSAFQKPWGEITGSSAAWSAAQMHTPSKILSFDLPYQTYVQQECFMW